MSGVPAHDGVYEVRAAAAVCVGVAAAVCEWWCAGSGPEFEGVLLGLKHASGGPALVHDASVMVSGRCVFYVVVLWCGGCVTHSRGGRRCPGEPTPKLTVEG